eukprot:735631_1
MKLTTTVVLSFALCFAPLFGDVNGQNHRPDDTSRGVTGDTKIGKSDGYHHNTNLSARRYTKDAKQSKTPKTPTGPPVIVPVPIPTEPPLERIRVYHFYNQWSRLHFYSTNKDETNVLFSGAHMQGIAFDAWKCPPNEHNRGMKRLGNDVIQGGEWQVCIYISKQSGTIALYKISWKTWSNAPIVMYTPSYESHEIYSRDNDKSLKSKKIGFVEERQGAVYRGYPGGGP